MAQPKEKPFKRKRVKQLQVKPNPLDLLCSSYQRELLKEIAQIGGVIICSGSDGAPVTEFYRGCRMYMRNPTFNGVAMFDTHIVYKNNWLRPTYILTLNDVGNRNILHSIRELKNGRLLQRYLYHPPAEE